MIRDSASPFVSSAPATLQDDIKELSIGESALHDFEDAKEPDNASVKSTKKGLTNGVGTKEYASPEQMSGNHYDQTTDIYSLGLIFMCLFSPTTTLSERYLKLKNCRKGRLPAGLLETYPQLSNLIQSMTSIDPSLRPTSAEILTHALFSRFRWECEAGKSPKEPMLPEEVEKRAEKAMVQIGNDGKLKEMYLKVIGGKLFGYKTPEEKKARFCYPLAECKIGAIYTRAIFNGKDKIIQERKENSSTADIDPSTLPSSSPEDKSPGMMVLDNSTLEVSHPDLETIYLMFNEGHILVNEICNG